MNYLQQANLEGFLAWQEKYWRGYVMPDAWPAWRRAEFTLYYDMWRTCARSWLATKRVRRRTRTDNVVAIWAGKPGLAQRRGQND